MADWYVSSAAYGGLTAFQTSHAYNIGDIVVPTAPALKAKWVFRCTTAGTSSTEPTWQTGNNSTNTTGSATFTNVTGQSTYFWTAAAGDIPTLLGAVGTNRFAAGDRMFVSSDHAETQTASTTYGATTGASFTSGQVLSVNRAGSTPPVAADVTAGATATVTTGSLILEALFPVYHYGMNYIYTGATVNAIILNNTGTKDNYFDTCQLYLNSATSSLRIVNGTACNVILNNTTLRFGATSHIITSLTPLFELTWLNTPSAIAGATFPATLFSPGSFPFLLMARGVDLSAITGTLTNNSAATGCKWLFDSCKIASGVTRYSTGSIGNTRDLLELANCYDGTNILSESYQPGGAVTTEFTITLSGGAADDVGTFSHKMVSGTNIDKVVNPLNGFWLDANNTATGSSKTATVEIISSATLNNDEISLWLEYEGAAGSSLASGANSFIATPLTTPSAVTSSSATWNSSPATPQKQKLQVTFTPQQAGRVRGQVRLGKASTTVYIDPRLTIA